MDGRCRPSQRVSARSTGSIDGNDVVLPGRLRASQSQQYSSPPRVRRRDASTPVMPTGCSPRTAERAEEATSPHRWSMFSGGDGLQVSFSITVLIGGALHADGQGLSNEQFLENDATIAARHNRVCLVEVASIAERALTSATCWSNSAV